tara:strand:- start:1048 stop:8394 length:7347 start_codon:yes stop_codon:yes gene_type:complete
MPLQIPTTQTGLEASIQAAAQKAGKNLKINLGANSKSIESLSQPLGRITGKADEFTKSMEAANARVLAFGASVGVLSAITRAFKDLVTTTIAVEKSLANINTILNVSAGNLDKFKKQIFDVARNTEQTFDTVAQAALELSRQGLKAEEVTKRLNDSMVLARLSGLGAAEAVSGLTAAINSFNSEGLTSSEVLNKIAAAAVKAAVSEKDLIEGIKRSGAVAIEAGVTFDELVGVISALQQQTARGGSVIGNSLKTIFTRLQSLEKLKTMERLGTEITDAAGNVLPATQLIQNLGKAIEGLPDTRKLQIAENLVGKFQIAPFLALLRDYNSETQVAINITEVASRATTEAYSRNVTLNKTLSAAISEATVNLKELANTLGEIGVTDSLKNILGFFNTLVSNIKDLLQGEGLGSDFAKGIVKGIGNVLSGPGLAIFGAIIAKLTIDLARFGTASLKTFFGLNRTAKEIANTQGAIASSLLKNSDIQKQILAIENSTLSVEQKRAAQTQFFTTALNTQLATMKQMQVIAASIAPAVVAAGRGGGRGRAAGGFIPNFDAVRGYGSEMTDIKRGVGGAPSSARPVTIPNFNFGGGERGTMVANTSEYIVPNYAGGGSAIFNQNMVDTMGLPSGARGLAAGGYIPNFNTFRVLLNKDFNFRSAGQVRQGKAGTHVDLKATQVSNALKAGALKEVPKGYQATKVAGTAKAAKDPRISQAPKGVVDVATQLGMKLPTFLTPTAGGGEMVTSDISQMLRLPASAKALGRFRFQRKSIKPQRKDKGKLGRDFEKRFNANTVEKFAERYALKLANEIASVIGAPPIGPQSIKQVENVKGFVGGVRAAMGGIFDAAVTSAFRIEAKDADNLGDFDYRENTEPKGRQAKVWMNALFGDNFTGTGLFAGLADMKFGGGTTTKRSMLSKTKKEILGRGAADARINKLRAFWGNRYGPLTKGKTGASGYIPNFAGALEDAVAREEAAGIPINQIRINQDSRLRDSGNPKGLAVTNMRDEPTGSIAGAAKGYIPNFQGGGGGRDALLTRIIGLQIAVGLVQGMFSGVAGEGNKFGEAIGKMSKAIMVVSALMMFNLVGGLKSFGAKMAGSGMAQMRMGRTSMAGPNMFHGLDMRKAQGLPPAKGMMGRMKGAGSFAMGAGRGLIGGASAALGAAIPIAMGIGIANSFAGLFNDPLKEAGRTVSEFGDLLGRANENLSKSEQRDIAGRVSENRSGGADKMFNMFLADLFNIVGETSGTTVRRGMAGGQGVELRGISQDEINAIEKAFISAQTAVTKDRMMGVRGSQGGRETPFLSAQQIQMAQLEAQNVFGSFIKQGEDVMGPDGRGVIDKEVLNNLRKYSALLDQELDFMKQQGKQQEKNLKLSQKETEEKEKQVRLGNEQAKNLVLRALEEQRFRSQAITNQDRNAMMGSVLGQPKSAEMGEQQRLRMRSEVRKAEEGVRDILAKQLKLNKDIKVSKMEYLSIAQRITSLQGHEIRDTNKVKGIFSDIVKDRTTAAKLEEMVVNELGIEILHLNKILYRNQERIRQEEEILKLAQAIKIERETREMRTEAQRDATTSEAQERQRGIIRGAEGRIRGFQGNVPTNAPARRLQEQQIAREQATIGSAETQSSQIEFFNSMRKEFNDLRGMRDVLVEPGMKWDEMAQGVKDVGDLGEAAREIAHAFGESARGADTNNASARLSAAELKKVSIAFGNFAKKLQRETAVLEAAARNQEKVNEFLVQTAGLKEPIITLRDRFIDFSDTLGQTIADIRNARALAATPSAKARLAFDERTAILEAKAGKEALARGEDPQEARGRVRGERVKKGFQQTVLENSILNQSDEEMAQRVTNTLVDGSVQFAQNLGSAMSQAVRDGTSFSEALKGAGRTFLDYISDAMFKMAAERMMGGIMKGAGGIMGSGNTGGSGGGLFSGLSFGGSGGGGGASFGNAAMQIGGRASGGPVTGGSGIRDDVPAMLTGGEFVMRKSAVDKHGVGFMNKLNEGRVQGFANGGAVMNQRDILDPGFSGKAISGKRNLMGAVKQGVTSGSMDFRRGGTGADGAFGVVALQPGSIRGTQFQRRNDPMAQRRKEFRRNALNLHMQQIDSEKRRQEAWDAEQQRLLEERIRAQEEAEKMKALQAQRRAAERRAKKSRIWSTVLGFAGLALTGTPIGFAVGSAVGGAVGGRATGGRVPHKQGVGQYLLGGLVAKHIFDMGGLADTKRGRSVLSKEGYIDRGKRGGMKGAKWGKSAGKLRGKAFGEGDAMKAWGMMRKRDEKRKSAASASGAFNAASLIGSGLGRAFFGKKPRKPHKNLMSSGMALMAGRFGEPRDARTSFVNSRFRRASGGMVPHLASGGGVDTVPAMLSGGEFVMNAAATQRIGEGNLTALNSGGGGGGGGAIIEKLQELINVSGGGGNNINITVNSDGTESSESGAGGGGAVGGMSLAARIRDSVTQILAQEKRLGGELRMG